jgi:hypothetical protein
MIDVSVATLPSERAREREEEEGGDHVNEEEGREEGKGVQKEKKKRNWDRTPRASERKGRERRRWVFARTTGAGVVVIIPSSRPTRTRRLGEAVDKGSRALGTSDQASQGRTAAVVEGSLYSVSIRINIFIPPSQQRPTFSDWVVNEAEDEESRDGTPQTQPGIVSCSRITKSSSSSGDREKTRVPPFGGGERCDITCLAG